MIRTQNINNSIVHPVPIDKVLECDKKPIKGYDILPEIYCNCFLLAKKKSGKSTVLNKMIRETTDPRTKIYAFVSTLNKDKTWVSIKNYCISKNIEFNGYTSIIGDNGENILQDLINELKREEIVEPEKKTKKFNIIMCDDDEDSEDEKKKKKKYRYRVPEYLFILDDLSTELSNSAVTSLLKCNRHYKSKIFLSNQYWNDLSTGARKNLDYMIIFGAQPKDKLQTIHKELDLSTTFDDFYKIYKFATKDKFNFLYIDLTQQIYRKNFNEKILI
jgi:hypothetical protein